MFLWTTLVLVFFVILIINKLQKSDMILSFKDFLTTMTYVLMDNFSPCFYCATYNKLAVKE